MPVPDQGKGMEKRTYLSYWIAGGLVALCGVAFVRLVAPAITGGGGKGWAIIGYLLVLVGMGILVHGMRKRHNIGTPRDGEGEEGS